MTHTTQHFGRIALNTALALLLAAVVAAGVLFRPTPSKPNFDFLPQMAHSPRYNAFAANPNFASGETLQAPEAHTVARGFMPLHYTASPQDALRAGKELQNPVADSANARQRGARVFAAYCSPCHGTDGKGNGVVAQRGYPPPPSLLAQHATAMKEGQLFHILTFGQNNMPSYASQISREDRWNAIVYLRSIQGVRASRPHPPDVSSGGVGVIDGGARRPAGAGGTPALQAGGAL